MTADAEKLREKVSRETQNVIKLKVAQDTAYWDQQERLQQVEAQRDRLQQNLVELQMQYEAVSAQYQDELRRRPETHNKVIATRELCTALEEYIERLTATVGRTRDDQVVLADMYGKAAQEIRQMNEDIIAAHNRANLKILTLKNNLERSEEREARAEKEAREESQNAADLRNRIEKYQVEYETTNSKLLNAMEQLERERSEAQRSMDEEHALRGATETRAAQLKAALHELELGHATALERAEVAETRLLEQDTLLKNKESEINYMTRQMCELETENKRTLAEYQQNLEQCEKKIEELTMANQKAESEVDEAHKALNEMRESGEKQLRKLETLISQKDAELNSKTEDITRLLREAKLATEATVRVEGALRDAHAAAHAAADHERALQLRITELEVALKDKTNALEEAAKFGRTLASDKERLQSKLTGLQNTIHNIDKELKDGSRREVPDREEATPRIITTKEIKKDSGGFYDFLLSEASEDYNSRSFDPEDIDRCYEALERGEPITEPLRTRGEKAMLTNLGREQACAEVQSSTRKRVFFKNKRHDSKKKAKPSEIRK
ncbi:hypothetical protein K1T71_005066 [Dendrolimus kikuchii]|uniref:Uncharacterized protein n=1 Tax=Dendrolimus kikuchii TaxID=765133 RepID=A0ACC1D618_9NEOP|nr:hypothetical protein K1T71_005066 [Dendrolimus kikuchii]